MATALLDVERHGPFHTGFDSDSHGGPQGVVSVHHLGFASSTAACTCGWAGRRRRLMAAAEQDAWVHSMRDRCTVSSPLVLDW